MGDDKVLNIPNIWPEGPKVLIEVDQVDSVTAGGIILPDSARIDRQLHLTMATVLRLGPDASVRMTDGHECVPGSRIIFAKYGGFRLQDMDKRKDLRIINDEDVLAVLET